MSSSDMQIENRPLFSLPQTKFLVSYILSAQLQEQSLHDKLDQHAEAALKEKLANQMLPGDSSSDKILNFWDTYLHSYKKLILNLEMYLINFAKPLLSEEANPKTKKEREILTALLDHYKFVVVSGEAQTGKSHLIQEVTTRRHQTLVRIYVTESLDTKSLLGNYV